MTVQQPTRSYATYQTRGDFNSVYPMMNLSVGLREGRLSERSPADHHRAARAEGIFPVQGDRLSHSFLPARAKLKLAKFAQAVLDVVLDVFAASYWLLYVTLWIVVILGLIPFALFCLLLIQF